MIQYINIQDTKHPVRINRRSMMKFEAITGKGMQSLTAMSTESISLLLFYGIEEGYRFLKEENPFKSYEQFEDILDEMDIMFLYEEASTVIAGFFTKGEENPQQEEK